MTDPAGKSSGPMPAEAGVEALLAKGRVGRYRVLERLGRGAMGTVLLAEDRTLHRKVALKVLPYSGKTEQERMFFEQFVRAARSAAALMHPAIVQIFSIGVSSGHAYIAMELLDGPNLAEHIKAAGPMPVALACSVAAEAAEGLAYAHEHGVLHRDIKPANIVLTKRNHAKVCDFGVAKLMEADDDFELPFNVVGSPAYLSPEAARGQSSPNADLWAISCVLWFMLTGAPPFAIKHADDARAVHTRLPLADLRRLRPDAPDGLVRVLERALALEINRRYHSGDELAAALKPFTVETDGIPVARRVVGGAVQEHDAAALAEAGRIAGRTHLTNHGRRSRRRRRGATRMALALVVALVCVLLLTAGGIAWMHHLREGTADDGGPGNSAARDAEVGLVTDGNVTKQPARD